MAYQKGSVIDIGRLTVFMDILLKADKDLSLFGYWTTM